MKLLFVGMTHLGIVSAVCAASKGFDVICFDPDEEKIFSLEQQRLPILEPHLDELLQENRKKISFTHDLEEIKKADLIYLAPDIATDHLGNSDLTTIKKLIDIVIQKADPRAILVVLSQVPPGFTETVNWPKSQLFYQVETLIFGQAVHRALYPERFIIGSKDPSQPLASFLANYLQAYGCPILPMSYASAELSKIAINMFLVSSVSTANTLADLCEKIGADWDEIVPALRLDKRIGPHAYLSAGLGLSGGNLERDLATFCSLANQHHVNAEVVRAWQNHSRYCSHWVLKILSQKIFPFHKHPTFALWGLSYKKGTASTKNSPALALLDFLKSYRVKAYDPAVKELPRPEVEFSKSALEACIAADALIIMTPWEEFRGVASAEVAQALKGKMIIDPFGVYSQKEFSDYNLHHFRLGA